VLATNLPLALAAAVYPTLLAGLIIVFALGGAVSTESQNSPSPKIDLTIGILSFVIAGVLRYRGRDGGEAARKPAAKQQEGDSWTKRKLEHGSPWVAFGAGLVLNLPGIWYLDALKDIAKADVGTAATILWVLLFVAIMFTLAEVPLVGYAVSPDGTRVRVERFQGWLSDNGRSIATWVAL
jgi:hypothetical protein